MTSALSPITITDYALLQIESTVGRFTPEKGGALLGIPYEDTVTDFLFDPDAQVTSVVYHNTADLVRLIAARESESEVRFKGILHSHPGTLARPSGQDLSEFATGLELNPGLPTYVSPIVTFDLARPLDAHEIAVAGTRISFFGSRRGSRGVSTFGMAPRVLPISESLERAGLSAAAGLPALVYVDRVPFIGVNIPGGNGLPDGECVVLFPTSFPTVPPLLIGPDGALLQIGWDLAIPVGDRLARALSERTTRQVRSASPVSALVQPDLLARSSGLVSESIRSKSVLIVGAGSVGSYLAEVMTRSGVGTLSLVDPDTVESHNIGRANFTAADIGRPKVEAVEARCRLIAPAVEIQSQHLRLEGVAREDLERMVRSADLVIATTDDNNTQSLLNHVTYHLGVPAVFVGLYREAAGGEVIVSRSPSPCWRCATAGLRETDGMSDVARSTDYGTGRLVAEPGLIADIHYVSAAAARIALGLLDNGGAGSAGDFLSGALAGEKTYVLFAMRPGYWFFPDALRDAFAQYTFQSVWMNTTRDTGCPVCGDQRESPFDAVRSPVHSRVLEAYQRFAKGR